MFKTLLAISGAVLLAAPSLHAQGARSFNGGGAHQAATSGGARSYHPYGGRGYAYRGGYYGNRGYGRYYYLGGVGYYYPFFGYGYGFGYPGYGYDGYWNGYGGEQGFYEGKVADQGGPNDQQGASLPSAVQRQLSKRGYYKGTVDGDFGPASRSALSRFQRDNHLKNTGRIDEDTLEALGFSDRR